MHFSENRRSSKSQGKEAAVKGCSGVIPVGFLGVFPAPRFLGLPQLLEPMEANSCGLEV